MGHYQACERRGGVCWTSRYPMRAGLFGLLCCDECHALPFSAEALPASIKVAAPKQRPNQSMMQFHAVSSAAHGLAALRTLAEEVG